MNSAITTLFYLGLIIGIFIFVMLIYVNIRFGDPILPKSEICLTPECSYLNNLYNDYVDKSFDPCKDFEKFACSKYVKTLEKNDKYTNGLEASTETAYNDLLSLLSTPVSKNDRILARITKAFYKSCMNPDLPAKMNQYIYKQLKKLRPVPLLDRKKPVPNWVDLYKKALETRTNVYSIMGINIDVIRGDYKEFYPTIKKGLLTNIPDEERKSRIDMIFQFFSDNSIATSKQMEEDLQEQMNIHNELVELAASAEDDFGLQTINDFKKKCPNVDWLKLFNVLYEPHKKLTGNDKIAVVNEKFLCGLHDLFKGKEKAIANHIFIHFAEVLVDLISNFLQANKLRSSDERSKECTKITNNAFPIGTGYMFILKRDTDLGTASKKEILRIINEEARYEGKIMVGNEANWLAEKTKKELVKKLDTVIFHFGFLKSNQTILEQISEYEVVFEKMDTSNEDPLYNYIEAQVVMKKALAKVTRIDFKGMFMLAPNMGDSINANAWYIPNNILLTYSLIVPLTYKHKGPLYHNYGAVGYICSHEYGHSLDSEFYVYSSDNVVEDFWEKRSEIEFKKRVECLIEEYDKADEPCTGTKISGEATLNENFADLFGLTIARRIYGKWLKGNKNTDLKLKDYSKYTPEQLFWISSSLVLCERRKKEDCEVWNAEDPHTIGPVRILMNLKMSPYFAKDWNCPKNSTMNPGKKCKVY